MPKWLWSVFPPDYWRMSDADLATLAKSYNVPHAWRDPASGQAGMDRDTAITGLVARDNARRTNLTFVSLLVSLVLTLINILATLATLLRSE